MADCENLFWDTNVFCAYFYDDVDAYGSGVIEEIGQYLREAKEGKWKIITSSCLFAELAFSKVKEKTAKTLQELVDDIYSCAYVIEANPQIMLHAGQLRDIRYSKGKSKRRVLSVPDSVMFATAIFVEDDLRKKISAFHTFDKGGARNAIPMLGYEDWCEGLEPKQRHLAERVIRLPRSKPQHPNPDLLNGDPVG